MKILLLSVFIFFGIASMNAQIAVTYTKVDLTSSKTYKTPTITKKVSSKKISCSLKRTVKIIPEEKKVVANIRRNRKKIQEEDIPF